MRTLMVYQTNILARPRGLCALMFINSIIQIQTAGKMQQTRSKILCKICKKCKTCNYVKYVTIEIFLSEFMCHCWSTVMLNLWENMSLLIICWIVGFEIPKYSWVSKRWKSWLWFRLTHKFNLQILIDF